MIGNNFTDHFFASGWLYGFGENSYGGLGLKHDGNFTTPTRIGNVFDWTDPIEQPGSQFIKLDPTRRY